MKRLKQAMMAAISDVLETMFFTSVEFNEQGTLADSDIFDSSNMVVCRLRFQGEFCGFFHLIAAEETLFRLTENFMGVERKYIDKAHVTGAIMELLNMLAGTTFTQFNDQVSFDLGIPEIISGLISVEGKEEVIIVETLEGVMAVRVVVAGSLS